MITPYAARIEPTLNAVFIWRSSDQKRRKQAVRAASRRLDRAWRRGPSLNGSGRPGPCGPGDRSGGEVFLMGSRTGRWAEGRFRAVCGERLSDGRSPLCAQAGSGGVDRRSGAIDARISERLSFFLVFYSRIDQVRPAILNSCPSNLELKLLFNFFFRMENKRWRNIFINSRSLANSIDNSCANATWGRCQPICQVLSGPIISSIRA